MSVSRRSAVAGLGFVVVLFGAAHGRALASTSQSNRPDQAALEQEALAMNRRAGELSRQGRLAEAVTAAKRGLALSELAFGKVHPNISADLITLANLYERQGDFLNAEPLIARAIMVDTELYGPQHPEVAVDMGALAMLLDLKGDPRAAEQKYRDALKMLLGHFEFKYFPSLAELQKGLGDVLAKQNRPVEALEQWSVAVEVLEDTDPQRAAQVLVAMAEIEQQRANFAAAEKYLTRAERLRRR